jgi:DNA anti-recombination protein RmuC
MVVTSLDTYEVAKQFQAVGFSDEQAGALAAALRKSQDLDLTSLATKADLASLASAMKADLAAHAVTTKADLASLAAAMKAEMAAHAATTKAELAALAATTKGDLASLAATTKADLAETKAEILKWMFGSMGIQTIVIIGAVVSLVRASGH